MQPYDLDHDSIARCVGDLSSTFSTKDVSTAHFVLDAHGLQHDVPAFNAAVGRHLSKNRTKLGLELVKAGGPRGAIWTKVGTVDTCPQAPAARSASARENKSADSLALGPQVPGDSPFMKRMRLHQSWFRAEILKAPFGTGPNRSDTNPLGSMLRPVDGEAGLNFHSGEIFKLALKRSAQGAGVERFRCLHNLLSSQPLCFNLFGPLVLDPELAAACLRPLIPDVERVLEIKIEFAPSPPREYLNDGTSFDAFVRYRTTGGSTAFKGIETKLTEPFSQTPVNTAKAAGYLAQATRSPKVFPIADRERLLDTRWFQLFRNHLLAETLRRHPSCRDSAGTVMVVRHPADAACASAVDEYRSLLRDAPHSVLDAPLDRLLRAWEGPAAAAGRSDWIAYLRLRYLDLQRSEAAWRAR